MSPRNKDFKVLEDLWYKKLESSGFKDIEKNGMLKWSTGSQVEQSYRNNGLLGQQSKQNYYRRAGFFAHDYKFDNKVDEIIWTLHAEGVGMRDISKYLLTKGVKKAITQVKTTIHRLRTEMYKLVQEEIENDSGI